MRLEFILLLALIGCSLAINGRYYVSPETGSSTNTGSHSNPFLSISDAMNAPLGDDGSLTIELLEGSYTGSENIGIVFTKPTKIKHTEDSHAVFDCNDQQQTVFTANSDFSVSSFIYNQITFQNCAVGIQVNGTGRNNENTFQFKHLHFSNVTTAIYSTEVQYLHIVRCRFENSLVKAIGTGASDAGMLLAASSFTGLAFDIEDYGHVLIDLVTVENVHSADSSPLVIKGGDIEANVMSVKDCSSGGSGGVLALIGPGKITMLAGQFEQCTSLGNGGAIYMQQMTGFFEDVRFSDCHAEGNGGAIYDNSVGAEFGFYQARFDNCSATYGGALNFEGRMFDASFNDVVFTKNYASVNGSCAACCVNTPNTCEVVPISVTDVYYMDNSGPGSLFTCEFDQ